MVNAVEDRKFARATLSPGGKDQASSIHLSGWAGLGGGLGRTWFSHGHRTMNQPFFSAELLLPSFPDSSSCKLNQVQVVTADWCILLCFDRWSLVLQSSPQMVRALQSFRLSC